MPKGGNGGGGSGVNKIRGNGKDNTLTGTEGVDLILGNGGNDLLFGLEGDDSLEGGDGNDTLEGGAGADILDGGLDVDTASYESSYAGVTVNLATGTGSGGDAEGDTLTGIENLTGSAFADVLTGDAGANVITGGDGDDTVDGGAGDDFILSSAGADRIEGGEGHDTLSYENSPAEIFSGAGVTVFLDNPVSSGSGGHASGDIVTGVEVLIGSDFDDTIFGSDQSHTIYGGLGDDHIEDGAGNDTLYGGEGDDFLRDLDGNDVIDGGAGNDSIIDHFGDDTIDGGDGNDLIDAGLGNDMISGGSGSDTFLFIRPDPTSGILGTGVDVITDYEVGIDQIWIAYGEYDVFANMTMDGVDTLIDLGDGNSIRLVGIDQSLLTAGDFHFPVLPEPPTPNPGLIEEI